jgi:hypothetical protein
MIEYKGFLIEPVQTSPGRWRAKIKRPHGRKIKVAVTRLNTIRSLPAGWFSAEAAIGLAEDAIDGGGMN